MSQYNYANWGIIGLIVAAILGGVGVWAWQKHDEGIAVGAVGCSSCRQK